MKNHVYVAACDKNGGIYHYTQNPDGSLEFIDVYPIDRATYLVIAEKKMYVTVRAPWGDGSDSGVISLDIDENGSLSNPSEISSTEGLVACHLCIDEADGSVFCANYVSGSVKKIGGKLSVHEGSGPNLPRQDKAHTHYVCLSPDKKYVFAVDLGIDSIIVYDKELNCQSVAKVPSGHGCRHLIFAPDGKTVFCANELASSLSAFSYESGKLTLIDTVSGLPEGFAGTTKASAIRYCDGKIYMSHRGYDTIACFSFDGEKLTLESNSWVGGEFPRDFDFIGGYVYSTNELTNNVTVLKKNADGSLSLLPFMYATASDPLCVVSASL